MAFFVVFLYLPILFGTLHGSVAEINDAIDYVADTLLYSGSALAVAAAMRDRPQPESTK